MDSVSVKIINKSCNKLPSYATEGSAGMDLYADIKDSIYIKPMERVLIPTGIYIELPKGYEAQVRPRSGLSLKKGLTVANAPGTIDSDYRGEIGVIMVNLSNEEQVIEKGERIAQMIVAKYSLVSWQEVDSIKSSDRGSGGFGHTGNK